PAPPPRRTLLPYPTLFRSGGSTSAKTSAVLRSGGVGIRACLSCSVELWSGSVYPLRLGSPNLVQPGLPPAPLTAREAIGSRKGDHDQHHPRKQDVARASRRPAGGRDRAHRMLDIR